MINKKDLINFLNTNKCSQEFALEIISEYIKTTKYKDKLNALINLIISNPQLLNMALMISSKKLIEKYEICSLIKEDKVILYF